tara:strand:- start:1457 stop:1687 length:231 start_codon:yes stop_codon:yes gene_type:complete
MSRTAKEIENFLDTLENANLEQKLRAIEEEAEKKVAIAESIAQDIEEEQNFNFRSSIYENVNTHFIAEDEENYNIY